MTIQTKPKAKRTQPRATPPTRRLFTIDEYERMIEADIIHEGERVELLGGEILCMAAMGSKHAAAVRRAGKRLTIRLGDRASVSIQSPIHLPPCTAPEPDIALLRPRDDDYDTAHPEPDDVLLVIEIADSSVGIDTGSKLSRYAEAAIAETWIWNVRRGQATVYRDPQDGHYTSVSTVGRGGALTPLAFPDLTIAVDEVLR
jgi:Uma2 family endonuclease